jgi:cytochrome c oxidase subunit 3
MYNNQTHKFHLVDPSPWPILTGFSALSLTFGFVLFLHGYDKNGFLFFLGLKLVLFMMFFWWRDIIREGTFQGQHTQGVQTGLKLGVLLFIVSEIMFFFAFFWGFFHSSFNPSIFLGGVWPPALLTILNPWKIPLLNTILLLTSGATVTLVHHSIICGFKEIAGTWLLVTISIALLFMLFQYIEYLGAPFSINTSVYGSCFFMLTGFHGFHVLVGTLFLSICCLRLYYNHFTKEHHFGFEAAAWYWHFVDVVWLFLFLAVYWWGS